MSSGGRATASPTKIAAIQQQLLIQQQQQQQQANESPVSSPKSKPKSKLKPNEQKQHRDKEFPLSNQFDGPINTISAAAAAAAAAATATLAAPATTKSATAKPEINTKQQNAPWLTPGERAKAMAFKIVRSYDSLPARSLQYFGTFCLIVLLVCALALIGVSKNDNDGSRPEAQIRMSKSVTNVEDLSILDSMSKLALTSAIKLEANDKNGETQQEQIIKSTNSIDDGKNSEHTLKQTIKEDPNQQWTKSDQEMNDSKPSSTVRPLQRVNSKKLDSTTGDSIDSVIPMRTSPFGLPRGPLSSLFEELLETASTHNDKPSRDEFDVTLGPRQATIIISSGSSADSQMADLTFGSRLGDPFEASPLMLFDQIMRAAAHQASHHHPRHHHHHHHHHNRDRHDFSRDHAHDHHNHNHHQGHTRNHYSQVPAETSARARWASGPGNVERGSGFMSPMAMLPPPLPHLFGMFPPLDMIRSMENISERPQFVGESTITSSESSSGSNKTGNSPSVSPPWLDLLAPTMTMISSTPQPSMIPSLMMMPKNRSENESAQHNSTASALPPHLENFTSVTSMASLPERRSGSSAPNNFGLFSSARAMPPPPPSPFGSHMMMRIPAQRQHMEPARNSMSDHNQRPFAFVKPTPIANVAIEREDFQSGDDSDSPMASGNDADDGAPNIPFGFAIASAPTRSSTNQPITTTDSPFLSVSSVVPTNSASRANNNRGPNHRIHMINRQQQNSPSASQTRAPHSHESLSLVRADTNIEREREREQNDDEPNSAPVSPSHNFFRHLTKEPERTIEPRRDTGISFAESSARSLFGFPRFGATQISERMGTDDETSGPVAFGPRISDLLPSTLRDLIAHSAQPQVQLAASSISSRSSSSPSSSPFIVMLQVPPNGNGQL